MNKFIYMRHGKPVRGSTYYFTTIIPIFTIISIMVKMYANYRPNG